jgi:hypothetical protein
MKKITLTIKTDWRLEKGEGVECKKCETLIHGEFWQMYVSSPTKTKEVKTAKLCLKCKEIIDAGWN